MNIVSLFATPVVLLELPDAPALNAELKATIEAHAKAHPGTQHSNLGGWQESRRCLGPGGAR